MLDGGQKLTAERLRELFTYSPDTGSFVRRVAVSTNGLANAGAVAGCLHKASGHIFIRVDGHLFKAHRLAHLYVTGRWPQKSIDHINGDGSDNRWANLRDVDQKTNAQNLREAHADNKAGLLGVHKGRKYARWKAAIYVDGKTKKLGLFESAEAAHAAYVEAKRLLHAGCTI